MWQGSRSTHPGQQDNEIGFPDRLREGDISAFGGVFDDAFGRIEESDLHPGRACVGDSLCVMLRKVSGCFKEGLTDEISARAPVFNRKGGFRLALKDVAKAAEVSSSTVSRVIDLAGNNFGSVEVRQCVWNAFCELGYVSNQKAQSLDNGTA